MITDNGGRAIKMFGDGCIATFDPDRAESAVDAALAFEPEVRAIADAHGVRLVSSVNVHMATVAEGAYEWGGGTHPDVAGVGVNQTFLLGGGPGVRISEPVYRALPNERRRVWHKNRPPATYEHRRS